MFSIIENKKNTIRKALAFLTVLLGICVFGYVDTAFAASTVDLPITVQYGQTEARSILNMINDMRTSSTDAWYWDESNSNKIECSGLQELTYSYELEKVAMKRAAEIAVSFSHTRPNGKDCFSAYDEAGVYSMSSGENIAAGHSSAYDVNLGWREDDKGYAGQGHRRNMLYERFNCVGIGHVYYNGTHYWVEEFGNIRGGGTQTPANDSKDNITVSVADYNILGYSVGATGYYNSQLYCGQSVTLPECSVIANVSGYWGYGNGCPIDSDVSYSVSRNSIASIEGKTLSVRGQGNVEVILTSGDSSGKLNYQVSHREEVMPYMAPTKSQTGLTEGSKCSGCGAVLVEQEVIPKLDSDIEDDTETDKKTDQNEDAELVSIYKINKTNASVKKGKTLTLKVSGAKGKVKWTSSNKKIATVNSRGVITAKKNGNVIIKAYDTLTGKTLSCDVDVYEKLSQATVSKKILKLKNKYKEGTTWTNDDYYFWQAARSDSYGCVAFVGRISDTVFGKAAKIKRHTSFSKIKAGDHIRIGDYHSVIVIKKNGNELTVAEGNYNSSIHWGRIITKGELKKQGFYVETRY